MSAMAPPPIAKQRKHFNANDLREFESELLCLKLRQFQSTRVFTIPVLLATVAHRQQSLAAPLVTHPIHGDAS